jgi:hypothetical protein
MEDSDQLHAPTTLPLGKEPPEPKWIWRWVEPRTDMNAVGGGECYSCRESNPDSSAVEPVAQSQYQLISGGSIGVYCASWKHWHDFRTSYHFQWYTEAQCVYKWTVELSTSTSSTYQLPRLLFAVCEEHFTWKSKWKMSFGGLRVEGWTLKKFAGFNLIGQSPVMTPFEHNNETFGYVKLLTSWANIGFQRSTLGHEVYKHEHKRPTFEQRNM